MKKFLAVVFFLKVALMMPASLLAEQKKLYFFNWSEYLPQKVIDKFEKETGIKIVYSTYDSNEALYAKVKITKGSSYDLVVPTGNFIEKMSKEGLLEKLDKTKLTNYKHLDENFLNKAFDPGNIYSVPYMWGTTVIALNSKKFDPKTVTSWEDLWKPQFKNQLLLLNDFREVFFIGLRTLGYSANTRDPKQIEAAYNKLKTLVTNVKVFDSQSPKVSFLMGEVNAGAIWNGEVYMAHKEQENIVGVLPKEGLLFWIDNLAIPKNAKNKAEAYQLINFILRPDVAKEIAVEIGYSTPNKEAFKLLDPKIRANTFTYPPADVIKKGEFQGDIGEAAPIYERYWEKLKTL